MAVSLSPRLGNAVGFVACVALMAYALYAEHVLQLEPCPLCVFQRIAVIAIGIVFLLAALHNPRGVGGRVYAVLIGVVSLLGLGIVGRHLWIQAQPPGTVPSCGASLDYMLDVLPIGEVLSKVFTGSGECGEVSWRLLGLSMPAWVGIAILALLIWGVWVNWRREKA